MKAVIYERYGSPDVLEITELEKPLPGENDVLVKVYATSLNFADAHSLTGQPLVARLVMGLFKPRNPVLGADIAGRVEAVGRAVTQFRPGDQVFGDIFACGCGGLAEYARAGQDLLALKPANTTFEQAAALPMAAMTALQALRDHGQIQPGQQVLIHGASGGVGTFAVQLARYFGAEVTAVCSPRNLEQARALGAVHVIDYTKEDFTRNGQQYDLILAANGYRSIFDYRRSLQPAGRYVMAGGTMPQIFQALLLGPALSRPGGRQMRGMTCKANQADLLLLKNLVETRQVKPVIDRQYPLDQAAEAFRYLDTGHARGKVVVTVLDASLEKERSNAVDQ